MSALILTYHGVEDVPGPLFVTPELFEEHLDVICDWGGAVLTLRDLAAALRAGRLPQRAVAISFDDGFASVPRTAAPLLAERGLTATVFCVAGRLGRTNDWPSQPSRVPRRPLATADELRELSRAGFEIGAHGFDHVRLTTTDDSILEREVVEARRTLEHELGGTGVTTVALPYGAVMSARAAHLVRDTYTAACTTRLAPVRPGDNTHSLPRIDVHYIRRRRFLREALDGRLSGYLRARSLGTHARRHLSRERTE